jgi:hypothetical protein
MQGQTKSFNIELHDIKPILDIQEYSFYYLLGASLLALMIVFGVIYLIYKWLKAKKAFNIRRENIKIINSLDLTDTKHSAYIITLLGLTFQDDSPRHTEMYNNLVKKLEPYKYKKEVEKFDSEVLGFIELYKGMIDV